MTGLKNWYGVLLMLTLTLCLTGRAGEDLVTLDTGKLLARYFEGDEEVLEELAKPARCKEINTWLLVRGSAAEVEKQLRALAADEYQEREAASAMLISMGPGVRTAVQAHALEQAEDPEVVLRCRRILLALEHVESQPLESAGQVLKLLQVMPEVDPRLQTQVEKVYWQVFEEKPDDLFGPHMDPKEFQAFCRAFFGMEGAEDKLLTWLRHTPVETFYPGAESLLRLDFEHYLPHLLAEKGLRVIPVMDLLVGPFRDRPTQAEWKLLMEHIAASRYHHEPFIKELKKYDTLPKGFLAELDLLFATDQGEMQEFCLYFVVGEGDEEKRRVFRLFQRLQKEKRNDGISGKIRDMDPTPAQATLFLEVLEELAWQQLLDARGDQLRQVAEQK